MTLALVIGGVIGVGIFFLPIALAPLGGSVPFGWLISGIGVMSMAYCASRIVSPDGGGLQAYVENELGPGAGFIVTWVTWCSSCVGNPAVALAAAAGLATIVPSLSGQPGHPGLGVLRGSDAGEPARDQDCGRACHRDCADQGASASCSDRHRGAAWRKRGVAPANRCSSGLARKYCDCIRALPCSL